MLYKVCLIACYEAKLLESVNKRKRRIVDRSLTGIDILAYHLRILVYLIKVISYAFDCRINFSVCNGFTCDSEYQIESTLVCGDLIFQVEQAEGINGSAIRTGFHNMQPDLIGCKLIKCDHL